jgi:hypothetical protein
MSTEASVHKEPKLAFRGTLLGLRRSAILEMFLFLGIAIAIDLLFFDGKRFTHASLHPFWLIVLLVSAQYGTREGLTAAVLSSLCLLIGNMPEQDLFQDSYAYLFRMCWLPVAWLSSALVLGELRLRQLRERDALRHDLDQTRNRENEISEAYHNISLIKDKLEARVAGQLNSAITMYQAAREMENLEPTEVLRGMADFVRTVMKPAKFSLFLLDDNILKLETNEGWSGNDGFARVFKSGSLLFREVIGGQRYLCCASEEDEAILASEGVLAGPLMAPEMGEAFGMLKIEKLGFLNLNFSNVQTFKVLCQWIATAYGNARRYQLARADSVMNIGSQLLSYGYFKRHTDHLSALAKRLGFDLSMLIIRLENADQLTSEKRSLVPAALAEAVNSVLRKTDLAFEHQRHGYEYAIVLPDTPTANVPIVADKLICRLRELLRDFSGEAHFSSTIHCLNAEQGGSKIHFGELVPNQVDFLTRLARRVGFNLSTIEIRLTNADDVPPETRAAVHEVITQLFESLLPADETIVAYRSAHCIYHAIRFARSIEEAQAEADQLKEMMASRLGGRGLKPSVSFSVRALYRHPSWDMADSYINLLSDQISKVESH